MKPTANDIVNLYEEHMLLPAMAAALVSQYGMDLDEAEYLIQLVDECADRWYQP